VSYLVLASLALIFGATDQYLGSLWSATHLGVWTIDVSLMSAPWLALPFIAGLRQPKARRAAASGAVVTLAALLGYFVMTLSSLEGVTSAQIHVRAFLVSQLHVILPGLVAGPLLGWLGHHWRTTRSWPSVALIAGAFCLEPLARIAYGEPFAAVGVATGEVIAGIVLGASLLLVAARARRDAGAVSLRR
jgi:hypothetical protein